MPTHTVRADWVRDQVFLLQDRAGFPLVVTQPMGANASDLLPMSLIGCTAWDVVSILRKERQVLTGLQITAECEQDPEPPWRYRSILIRYRLTGRRLQESKVARAITLAESKYCSIYATLRDAVTLHSVHEIVEEAGP